MKYWVIFLSMIISQMAAGVEPKDFVYPGENW